MATYFQSSLTCVGPGLVFGQLRAQLPALYSAEPQICTLSTAAPGAHPCPGSSSAESRKLISLLSHAGVVSPSQTAWNLQPHGAAAAAAWVSPPGSSRMVLGKGARYGALGAPGDTAGQGPGGVGVYIPFQSAACTPQPCMCISHRCTCPTALHTSHSSPCTSQPFVHPVALCSGVHPTAPPAPHPLQL